MTCIGKVSKGAVKLPAGIDLPDGTAVELVLPESAKASPPASEEAFVLREIATDKSAVRDLPDDLAINHDYYRLGVKKREPRAGHWIRTDKSARELTGRQAVEFTNKLLELAADTRGLPSDLSANHDHYLHGRPKP